MAIALVIICFLLVVGTLFYKSSTGGVEAALPAFAFVVILLPDACQIPIPGLFGLTAWRLAVVTLVICNFAFPGKRPEGVRPSSTPLKYLIFLHIAWSLVACFNSIVPAMSFKKVLGIIFEYYVVYWIFYQRISSTETIRRIVKGMVSAMAVTTIFGAYEGYTGWSVLSWFPTAATRFATGIDQERGIRAQSTFPHAILYGAAIAMALPLLLEWMATSKTFFRKAILWAAMMLMFLCLYKTSSRGPWVASIFGFLLVFAYAQSKVRKYMVIIGLMCITVMVVRPGVYDTIKGFYEATFDPESPMGSSYEYRYALKDVSVHALDRSTGRQLWGYGPESFYFLHLTGPFLGKEEHKFESCDSEWIDSMVETGYVGFAIFATLLGSAAFLIFWTAWKARGPDRYLCWIFSVNVIQYYWMMLSVAMYAWGQNGYMLWMIIAMGLATRKLQSQSVQAPVAISVPKRDLELAKA